MSVRLGTEVRNKPFRRPTLSTGMAFWATAMFALLGFAANTAASPLYRIYQAEFGFSATTLTLLFSVYIVALLFTLLVLGSVSDYVGRRRVMLAGLVSGAVACAVFLLAHGVGLLFCARALQGVTVGLLAGAASAALHDLRPNSGATSVVSSVMPTGGQALGAIGASALAQYAVAPTRLVWWLLLAAFITGAVAVLAIPEPGNLRPGAMSSLRPQISLPAATRGAFAVAIPALIGMWALSGLYLSLGPSLALQLLHSENLLWGGVLILLLTGVAAAASAFFAKRNPSGVMLGGCLALIAGAMVTFAAIETGTAAVLFVGTAVAGLGLGSAFTGAYRSTVGLASPDDRAGLITAIYIVGYLSTGIPAVLGGIATTNYGLRDAALAYSVGVAVLAASAVALLAHRMATGGAMRRTHEADAPPGPGTVPPCPPIAVRPGEAPRHSSSRGGQRAPSRSRR